ncbi:AAA family ATPase [Moraxella sp.]|uniref:AAA family ATPase n=1 Tax=Moraxella sp. TaxID=479 RepID=UPI0026DC48A8|nr:AAA family ATPase [Moraxella sp.]MDO4895363.1 AAA family ATPase [Moraxella sp.]
MATNNLISSHLKSNKGKQISSFNQEQNDIFEKDFLANSYCYFPSDRYELPYWINKGAISQLEQFKEIQRFSNKLNRDILVRKSLDNIKAWILDVFLDSRADLLFENDGSVHAKRPIQDLQLLQTSIRNIEKLIGRIVQKDIVLDLNLRGASQSRIRLIDISSNLEFVPSLDNLSAGQSTLLSIFGTIIQYSDKADLTKSINLSEIQGIVIIDEIDLHLHIELQNKVLPELIKLFPKIQFIITTHSPFFLAGLSETFSQEEYLLVNMPNGDIITDTSRFEEFKKAYDLFVDINNNYKYELDILHSQIRESTKPLIITEGKTDWKHIKSALKHLAPYLDIEFLEYEEDIKMGDATLKTMAENLKSLPNQRKIICIFDRDNNDILKSYGQNTFNNLGNNVFTMCIPKISDELDRISIEFYYIENDLSRKDSHGRKLFLGTEFHEGTPNSICGKYQTKKMDKCKIHTLLTTYSGLKWTPIPI